VRRFAALAAALVAAAPAAAAPVSRDVRFTASDGVSLQATVTGEAPLTARPTIVEFSPYGRNSETFDPSPAYNALLVQIRGTGDSDGRFDALGPRTQADVAEVLRWACGQRWSNGILGLNGFSASAITVYNSLHLALPCVKAAVLKSGTHELYRDLIYPGAISNLVPDAGVLALIGAPAVAQSPARPAMLAGLLSTGLSGLTHSTLDAYWRERGIRGDVNHLPILIIDGFFDVESRGAFQAFQQLRGDGARLEVVGAHDGAPAGTDGGKADAQAWFDHHLLGTANGIEAQPAVKLWLADGDREDDLAGRFVRVDGSDWPIPGTSWATLTLDAGGSLRLGRPTRAETESYPQIPSLTTNSDPYNTAIAGSAGLNALTTALPVLSDMTLAEKLGRSYTTWALRHDVLSAGPASLELRLASSAPQTNIWAVISDVWPDGTPHPMAAGRLNSDFPDIDLARSLRDPQTGAIVQPYGRYDRRRPATPGRARLYHIEFWPIGNRFRAGHRIRLTVLGASAASLASAPGVDSIAVGGRRGSRLLFPVLPGSDLSRRPRRAPPRPAR
jgi:predicted acyl esterase